MSEKQLPEEISPICSNCKSKLIENGVWVRRQVIDMGNKKNEKDWIGKDLEEEKSWLTKDLSELLKKKDKPSAGKKKSVAKEKGMSESAVKTRKPAVRAKPRARYEVRFWVVNDNSPWSFAGLTKGEVDEFIDDVDRHQEGFIRISDRGMVCLDKVNVIKIRKQEEYE